MNDNLKRTSDTFRPDTINYQIFNLNAPYSNPYQGDAPRWLFVCSAGLLRSPTAAHVAVTMGANARSCGSHTEYALVPLSANLIAWADAIFFVNPENFKEALRTFKNTGWEDDIESKSTVWNIPDRYEFGHPDLFNMIKNHLEEFKASPKNLT